MASLRTEFRDFLSSVISFPADYFAGWFGVAPSESGVEVNELTAMQIPSYVGCVRVLGDAVSLTPLEVVEINKDGSEAVTYEHPLADVLRLQMNPETTAADVKQTGQVHLLQTGNCYGEIGYNGAGQPAAIYLRSPFATFPYRNIAGEQGRRPDGPLDNGELFYKTTDTPGHYERAIRRQDMVHVKGLGLDSLVGLSPIKYYGREVIGTDLAAQSFSAKFFANDARPGGYLKAPGFLNADKKKQAIASWMAGHARGQANKPALLDGGWSWEKVGVPPDEAQFIETRKFNREQIAAIFGVPPHFLGISEESRANMEQRALEFLVFVLKPWLNKWEQALNIKLFPRNGRNAGRFYARFNTTNFERATYADLLKGVQMGRYAGLYTVDEGRALLGEQPYSEKQFKSGRPGDKLWQPVNMIVVNEESVKGPQASPAAAGNDEGGQGGQGQGGSDQDGGDGGSKPASGTGQGGKRDADAELKHYFRLFSPTFRDALGRILARRNPDEADFQRCFAPTLTAIAAAFECDPITPGDMRLSDKSAQIVGDYIRGIAHRVGEHRENARAGTNDSPVQSDQLAAVELRRAIEFLREKCHREPDPDNEEEDPEDELPVP
jgi:HK97 family phage portal protein